MPTPLVKRTIVKKRLKRFRRIQYDRKITVPVSAVMCPGPQDLSGSAEDSPAGSPSRYRGNVNSFCFVQ